MSPRLCLFDARADHLCFEALNVVLRSFNGVNVLDERGVVVFRRGVTEGAIVTLGRVELRLVDAWDWARALSGIFVGARASVFKGLLKKAAALRRSAASSQRQWVLWEGYELKRPWVHTPTPCIRWRARFLLVFASMSRPLAPSLTGSFFWLSRRANVSQIQLRITYIASLTGQLIT